LTPDGTVKITIGFDQAYQEPFILYNGEKLKNTVNKFDNKYKLVIEPRQWSRGFYVHNCSSTIGDLKFRFMGYDDEYLKYDTEYPFQADPTQEFCTVGNMRGVKYAEFYVDSEGQGGTI
jgi:hypothetical protein